MEILLGENSFVLTAVQLISITLNIQALQIMQTVLASGMALPLVLAPKPNANNDIPEVICFNYNIPIDLNITDHMDFNQTNHMEFNSTGYMDLNATNIMDFNETFLNNTSNMNDTEYFEYNGTTIPSQNCINNPAFIGSSSGAYVKIPCSQFPNMLNFLLLLLRNDTFSPEIESLAYAIAFSRPPMCSPEEESAIAYLSLQISEQIKSLKYEQMFLIETYASKYF